VNDNTMLLVFTFGISLQRWKEIGSLDREIKPYLFLASKGYKITFLTYGDTADLKIIPQSSGINIIPVYSLYNKSRFTIINIIKSLAIVFYINKYDSSYDLIKTNQLWGAWAAILLKLKYSSKMIVRSGYDPYMNELNNRISIKRFIYKYNALLSYYFCDYIFVTTDPIKKFLMKTYGVDMSKVDTIPNFIDTSLFSPDSSFKQYSDRVLYVGRLSSEKNIVPMAELFIGSNIQLDIIGSGECLTKLINLRDNHNANINIIGPIDNSSLAQYYKKYKILLLLSKYEGHPKTLLEAMSTGVIPVGLNVQGINSVIDDGVNGFLVESISDEVLSLINSIINNHSKLLSINARNSVLECCSMDKVFLKEHNAYHEILSGVRAN
jgi:glycosyltransferase involved in cell wall biosynthesis